MSSRTDLLEKKKPIHTPKPKISKLRTTPVAEPPPPSHPVVSYPPPPKKINFPRAHKEKSFMPWTRAFPIQQKPPLTSLHQTDRLTQSINQPTSVPCFQRISFTYCISIVVFSRFRIAPLSIYLFNGFGERARKYKIRFCILFLSKQRTTTTTTTTITQSPARNEPPPPPHTYTYFLRYLSTRWLAGELIVQ